MRAVPAWARAHNKAIAAAATGVVVVGTLAALRLAAANGTLAQSFSEQLGLVLAFYVYFAVGVVLVLKRAENPLSWLVLGIGLLPSVGSAVQEYAQYALVTRPGLAGGMAAAWFNQWWWFVNLGSVFVFLPLLFPTGHPPSPRWRWLLRSALVLLAGLCVVGMFAVEYSGQTGYRVANPLGAGWAGEDGPVSGLLFAGTGICMLLTLVSLGIRFRRSTGIERQQVKWFVFAGVFTIGLPLLELLGAAPAWTQGRLFDVALCLPPVAIGVAVARYRLYDIDRIISRTLTYGLVTATLLALYLGAVTALTTLTAPITRESTVAVAAATLLAAAAFGPVRQRVQVTVDRRFNRARYDAARTLDRFRARLRDELDLTSITASVQGAVDETVQPTRAVLWLREVS